MTAPSDDPQARLRRSVYLLLIMLGTGAMLGRILAVDAVNETAVQEHLIKRGINTKRRGLEPKLRNALEKKGLEGQRLEEALQQALEEPLRREESRLRGLIRKQRPFLSANDRSRWCTVRALVEPDMRVIEVGDDGSRRWVPYAIDKVINQPTWDTIDMVKHDGHLYSSKPPLLPTLMAAEYWVIHRLTGITRGVPMSLGEHPYWVGRLMLATINVISLVIYFLLLARLVERFGRTDWGRCFVMAAATFGTFLTTFAVVFNNHLPAAVSATVALYAAVRIWFDGERRLRYFVVAGLFAAFTAANELPALALLAVLSVALLWKAPRQTILGYVPAALVVVAGFFGTNWIAHHSLRPPYMHRSEGDNWYDYTYVRNGKEHESYWNNPVGIDRGEPSPAVYGLHVLVGHHGIFSLTPIWLLSGAGAVTWICGGRDRRLRELGLLIGGVTLVCLAFYLSRPLTYRNYGGVACGFRWMFWFAPLWLVVMLPAVDAMASRGWTRLVALVMLAVSVLSASYPTWNPWAFPWIMDYLSYLKWIG